MISKLSLSFIVAGRYRETTGSCNCGILRKTRAVSIVSGDSMERECICADYESAGKLKVSHQVPLLCKNMHL